MLLILILFAMIKNIFFLFLVFVSLFSFGQDKKTHKCGSDELHFTSIDENKDYKNKFDKNNIEWQKYAQKHSFNWNPKNLTNQKVVTPPNYTTLTVVFHDLTNSSSFLLPSFGETSYQYILDKLNLIYNGTNLNGTSGNNTFINFCLARRTQNNINYTVDLSLHSGVSVSQNLNNSNVSQIEAIANTTSVLNNFHPSKYINIYIVDSIIGGVAGFATLPSSHGNLIDGIYIEREYLINDSNINTNMNVLAHEMGHYLGLFHTFGICRNSFEACSCDNANCLFNGDMICDTPPNQEQMTGYSEFAFPNTCTDIFPPILLVTDGTHPINETEDPKDNYMDYGIWDWQNTFTNGQITRMNFMIDPIFGPRNSLLGQAPCLNCDGMNNCAFTISTFPSLNLPRNYITQDSSGITPPIQINLTGPCVSSMGSDLSYTWSLVQLGNPNTIISNGIGSSYTTASSLNVGNYQLTISALLTTNNLCVTNTTYGFTILPPAGNCNLIVPTLNSLIGWSNNNWNRISFSNGWVLNTATNTYPIGSIHKDNTEPGFDETGFDVLSISPGNSISTLIDPILGGIPLGMDANIDRVMRVGKFQNGGGQAFYAKQTITINRTNCKFKIWFLGAVQSDPTHVKYPFQNELIQNDASFWYTK